MFSNVKLISYPKWVLAPKTVVSTNADAVASISVPAGEVWVIFAAQGVNLTTNGLKTYFMTSNATDVVSEGAYKRHHFFHDVQIDDAGVEWTGVLIFTGGTKILMYVEDCIANDELMFKVLMAKAKIVGVSP